MADRARARSENVPGEVYVDDTCIDCDTCRWMAPAIFDRAGDMSRVHRQPSTAAEQLDAAQALLSCPTASIGASGGLPMKQAVAELPRPIAAGSPVGHCGFHAEASFGAASYFLQRDDGNVLVDSPRFAAPLVKRLEALGGVHTLFLTHRDDVADHAKFAAHFGCERVLHADDVTADTREVERVIEGRDPVRLADDLLVIPTPGHTRGSACLLHADTHLFTGDHLAWSERLGHLYAFRSACWYDWDVLRASMARLREHDFSWVLPGHGWRKQLPVDAMRASLDTCLAWMEQA